MARQKEEKGLQTAKKKLATDSFRHGSVPSFLAEPGSSCSFKTRKAERENQESRVKRLPDDGRQTRTGMCQVVTLPTRITGLTRLTGPS